MVGMHPRLLDLDLRSLELFASAADLGSISKAASRHHLSQPMASRRLSNLEHRLGFQLLHRTTTGVALSPRGSRFLPIAHRLLADLHDFGAETEALSTSSAGIALAATSDIARHDLPAHVAAFAADRAGDPIALRISVESIIGICRDVRSGDVDLGVVDGPAPPIGLGSEVVARAPMTVVVHPDHHWARKSEIELAELASTPTMLPPPRTGTRDVIDAALRSSGLPRIATPLLQAGTDQSIVMAIAGAGPAVLRPEAAAEHLDAGRLVAIDTAPALVIPIRLAWKGRRAGARLARAIERIRALTDGDRAPESHAGHHDPGHEPDGDGPQTQANQTVDADTGAQADQGGGQ